MEMGSQEGILHDVFMLLWLLSMAKVCWSFDFLLHAGQHMWAAGKRPGEVAQTRPRLSSLLPHFNELPIVTLPSPRLFEQSDKWLPNLPCILLRRERAL